MGIAIVIPKIKYKDNNLGKVSFKNIDIEGLLIEELESSYTERTVQLNIEKYIPAISASIGVYWEITEGSEYASINADGLLTINPIADNNEITVKAYSKKNSDVFDTVTFTITYMPGVNRLDDINDIVLTKYKDYENRYLITPSFIPENTNYTDVSIHYNTADINYNDVSTYTKIKNGNILIVKKTENTLNVPLAIDSLQDNSIKCEQVKTLNYVPEKSWYLGHYIGMINLMVADENVEPLGKLLNDNNCTLLVEMSDECKETGTNKYPNCAIYYIGLGENASPTLYGINGMGALYSTVEYGMLTIPITTYNASEWNTTNTTKITNGRNADYINTRAHVLLHSGNNATAIDTVAGRRILTTNGRIFVDNIEITNYTDGSNIEGDDELYHRQSKVISRDIIIPRYLTFGFAADASSPEVF